MNSFFCSQSSIHVPDTYYSLPTFSLSTDSRINEQDVYEVLTKLNPSKANGHDKISNRVLKEVAPSLAGPLSKLFQKSLHEGKLPSQLKEVNVVPIHKKL